MTNDATGAVRARAAKGIYLAEIGGDLNVNRIESAGGSIYVAADGSILDAGAGSVHFEGVSVTLTAKNGSVGTGGSRITTVAAEKTNVRAALDIYLAELSGDLWADYTVSESGSVDLLVPDGEIRIDNMSAAKAIALETRISAPIKKITASDLKVTLTGAGSSLTGARPA